MKIATRMPAAANTRDVGVNPRWVGRRNASAVLVAGTALVFAGYRTSARAEAVKLVVVDIAAVDEGYRASQLLGKSVRNDKNETIGTLDDLVITKNQALYAVLQVGAFLGLGGHLIAVPYDSLNITDDGQKIILPGASKDALGKLPQYQKK